MRQRLNQFTQKILLPRGLQYVRQDSLHKDWTQEKIDKKKSIISIYYKETKGADTTVILNHPYLAEAHQYFIKGGYYKLYLSLNCHVILLDFNGFGESTYTGFNYSRDIRTVVEYAINRFKGTRIVVHGISFGGNHLMTYASQKDHHLHKIIIENSLDHNLAYYKIRNKKLFYFLKALTFVFRNLNKNADYIEACRHIHSVREVLFIYNDEDKLTPIETGNNLYNACPVPKKMEIMNGKHLEAYPKNPVKYREIIKNFISE